MEPTKASRPQKVPRKPLPPVDKPESIPENKYARRQRIGPPNGKGVTTVGLGKLEVITTYAKHPDV